VPVLARSGANAVTLAAVMGVALWWITALVTGQREAWDVAAYWAITYPLAIAACAGLGYYFPDRPWR